jgi:lysophospholipase L1-like esterase
MKALQIILITLTTLTGCNKKPDNGAVTNPTSGNVNTMSSDSLTYLALGDSYTIGEAEPLAQSFPYQLTDSLNKSSFKVHSPTIIATTGWTTDNLIAAIADGGEMLNTKKFDIVTLLIGVNDQYQGLSQSNYAIKFAQMLNTAISFARGDTSRVFVISIPDYGVTPFADGRDAEIGPQIDQFNAINQSISLKAGVHYLNITPISRMAATDTSLIAPDGLHPSAKMYSMWVKLLSPVVAAQLRK